MKEDELLGAHRQELRRGTVVLACLLSGCAAFAAPGEEISTRLLVKPRPGVPACALDEWLRGAGARRIDAIPQIGVFIVEVPPGNERAAAQKLRANPHIEFVEFDTRLPPAK